MELELCVPTDNKLQSKDETCNFPLFSQVIEHNSTFTQHELKSVREYFSDLQTFLTARLGPDVKLPIPQVYSKYEGRQELVNSLKNEGYQSKNWLSTRLTGEEVEQAVHDISLLHAAGLAYRMSMKQDLTAKYPWITEDLYTSNKSKMLLAKYLDSYLHYLSSLAGCEDVVFDLQKYKPSIFKLILSLRKPSDTLGNRFRTICHGDLWMGSLMFREGEQIQCQIIDFHSTGFMSPASDLAHLMLTSTSPEYMQDHWDEIVESYYESFTFHLANLGLVLKHLGTNKAHFQQEVRRALAGEMLCLGVVTPILAMCGPKERTRSRSTSDRENTVKHLIQMMSILEVEEDSEEDEEACWISEEWMPLHQDPRLRQSVIDVLLTCRKLGVLEELKLWSEPEDLFFRGRRKTI